MKQIFALAAALAALLVAPASNVAAQESAPGSTLKVQVSYTGSGAVDDQHKVWVFLWDSPDFATSGQDAPFTWKPLASKSGTVTFDDVKKTPVYVSLVYDPTGQWDVQSAPPDGCSLGLYAKTPGKPEPVELRPGKTISIDVSFDDSVKMQNGKATRQ